MKIDWKKLIVSLLLPWVAGFIGSVFTFPAISDGWYDSLNKPPITPPSWLFSPMWTTLYFFMGVAFYMVWVKGGPDFKLAKDLFLIQLGLNAFWSILFFGMGEVLFAGVEIVFLWFFILATIVEFYGVDKRAAYVMLPYLAWTTLATLLNIAVIFYN